MLRVKPLIEEKYPDLLKELKLAQQNLAKLKKKNSVFDVFKIKNAEEEIKKLKKLIVNSKRVIDYKIPD